jgi:hypothetical protein
LSPDFFVSAGAVLVGGVADVSVVSVRVLVIVVSVRSGAGGDECRSRGIGGVLLPTVSVTTGALGVLDGRGDVRGRLAAAGDAGVDGSEPAIVAPEVSLPRGFGFVGSVRFVVVSTFVSVVAGALVSPGALIVEVTLPLAEPSCTTSYCCWPRCIFVLERLQPKMRSDAVTMVAIL